MKRLIFLVLFSFACLCVAQEDVPVFTDSDLEEGSYSDHGMTLTGIEEMEKPAEAPEPVADEPKTTNPMTGGKIPLIEGSQFYTYLKGIYVDVQWLTMYYENFYFLPTKRPKDMKKFDLDGVYCIVPIFFKVKSMDDTPAGMTFEVVCAFEKLNPDGSTRDLQQYPFYLTPSDFTPDRFNPNCGTYEKSVALEGKTILTGKNPNYKLYIWSVKCVLH